MTAWSCHKIWSPCTAPSPAFAKVGDGNAISQSRHRRFQGSLPPVGRRADLRLDVALPTSGEGLRAELGELFGVGAAGRVPLHDAPNRKGRNILIIKNKIGFMNFRSYSKAFEVATERSRSRDAVGASGIGCVEAACLKIGNIPLTFVVRNLPQESSELPLLHKKFSVLQVCNAGVFR